MARPSIVVLLITLVVGLAQAAHFNAMRGHVAQDFYAQNEYLLARSFLSVCLPVRGTVLYPKLLHRFR